jgi:hypothetical protein
MAIEAMVAAIFAPFLTLFTPFLPLFATIFTPLATILAAITTIRHHWSHRRCDQPGDQNPFPSHSHESSTDEGIRYPKPV